MGNSSKDEGDSNKKSKKATGLDKQNNNLVRAARLFCAKLPNFTRPLYGGGERSTKTFFF